MSSILDKGEVITSTSLLLPPFSNQIVKNDRYLVYFKSDICQSLRFTCFTSFDLLLITSMNDYCLFCSHIDLEIKLI